MKNTGIGQNNMQHFGAYLNNGNTVTPSAKPEEPKPTPEQPEASPAPEAGTPSPEQPKPEVPESQATPEQPQTTETPENNQPPENPEAPETPETPEQPENQPLQLDENSVLGFLKDKYGKEITSIDELFKPKEEAPVDPWANVSDEVVQFKKYNEETGRGFEDFMRLNRDVNTLDPIQLAREKVGSIIPGLSTKEIDEYLENKLNIDVSNPGEMSNIDKIELESFVKDYRAQLKSDQEKYKQPIERPEQPKPVELKDLGNGIKMSQEDYQKFENIRNQYINGLRNSTDKITNSVFEVKVDDNGSERTIQLSYDYSKDDKHKMVSSAMDTQSALESMFTNDKGEIDHVGIQEAMFWANPELRAKAIASLVHKTRAEQLKDLMKSRTNANFSSQPQLPKNGQPAKTVPIPGMKTDHGIKHDFSQFIKSN